MRWELSKVSIILTYFLFFNGSVIHTSEKLKYKFKECGIVMFSATTSLFSSTHQQTLPQKIHNEIFGQVYINKKLHFYLFRAKLTFNIKIKKK